MSQTATVTGLGEVSPTPVGRSIELQRLSSKNSTAFVNDAAASEGQTQPPDVTPPAHAHGEVERWNKPKGNIGRLGFAFLSFIIAGMNDAAIGVPSPEPSISYEHQLTKPSGSDPIRKQHQG
jgi:hypothetical protein